MSNLISREVLVDIIKAQPECEVLPSPTDQDNRYNRGVDFTYRGKQMFMYVDKDWTKSPKLCITGIVTRKDTWPRTVGTVSMSFVDRKTPKNLGKRLAEVLLDISDTEREEKIKADQRASNRAILDAAVARVTEALPVNDVEITDHIAHITLRGLPEFKVIKVDYEANAKARIGGDYHDFTIDEIIAMFVAVLTLREPRPINID